jgi:parallel beta-helix repeat protein
MDIDVDSANGWLYAGGYQSHRNLIRHGLNDSNNNRVEEIVETGMGGVIGLAVSQESHHVYMTTYNHELEAWDTNEWKQIDVEDIGDGAGVCVAEAGYVPPFDIVKIDDVVGCASPRGEEITYTISIDYQWDEFGYTDPNIIESIEVVDYLPAEVNFVSAQPDDGLYEYDDPDGPRYTWTLTDSNSFGDTLSFELVVQSQNERMTPGGKIENNVEVIATINEGDHVSRFTLQTPVCDCSGYTEVIYVDETASPGGNGQTWSTAFKYLQDALAVALPCDEIWVADGTYKPTQGSDPNFTFQLVNGVGVYGGFEGEEEERTERNWADPLKETTLSGDIAGDEDSYYVVSTGADVEVGCLDGFTIKDGGIAGIYCERSSPVFQHNKITASGAGIYCVETEQPVIKNNWIYKNDNGIYFDEPSDTPIVRNNTIAYNTYYGLSASDIDPNISITNCILWENGTQLNLDFVPTYSCIQNWTQGGPGNISNDPCFAGAPADDYHVQSDSPCIDKGDPDGDYTGERDIDKHFRVLDGDGDDEKRVDMGADEYCDEGYDNDADFNNDCIVDTNDLIEMATAWLVDSNDPGWESQYDKYDLYDDNVVNYGDFAYFAKEWLWMTCDKMQGYEMMEMMMGMGGGMGRMMGG